jgi:hypothetical protein
MYVVQVAHNKPKMNNIPICIEGYKDINTNITLLFLLTGSYCISKLKSIIEIPYYFWDRGLSLTIHPSVCLGRSWVPRCLCFKSLGVLLVSCTAAIDVCRFGLLYISPMIDWWWWWWWFFGIGGMNLAGETEVLGGNLPRRHSVHHKIPHDQTRSRTPDRRGGKPATNRLSYGAAIHPSNICFKKFKRFRLPLILKNAVFWDVATCRPYMNRRFGGTYRLHFQCRKIRERGRSVSKWLQTESPVENTQLYKNREEGSVVQSAATCSRWFLARGFFYHENGGDKFLRNVGSYKIYTAQQLRRRHSL